MIRGFMCRKQVNIALPRTNLNEIPSKITDALSTIAALWHKPESGITGIYSYSLNMFRLFQGEYFNMTGSKKY